MAMRTFLLALAAAAAPVAAAAQTPAPHAFVTPGDVTWGPAPPTLPPGAMIAVLDGDPTKPGPFVVRLKIPDGYKIAPHWHPTDERLTILQGNFRAGMGEAFDEAALRDFPAGSFISMPKEMRHFAMTRGETIVQVQSTGPFVVNYVNPKDDPTKKGAPSAP
jgi:hypothetical protein